jgi:nitroreductase
VALIAPKPADGRTQASVQYDLGQAAMSMMIMAADRGVGTGHSAVSDQDLAQRILGFPDDRMCAWLLPMGYPADRPLKPIERPNRRPFDEVVHRGRW